MRSARRGVYRGVFSALIDDPDYQRLSAPARLVLLTLRVCSQAGAAGIFRAYTAVLAEQTGLPVNDVDVALQELATSPAPHRPWILREGGIVWVRNALRYDPHMRVSDPKHRAAIERVIAALPRLAIVAKFCRYYEIASPFARSPKVDRRPADDPPGTNPLRIPSTEVPSTENRGRGRRKTSVVLTDDQFLASLRANTGYKHLDIEAELGRMDAWLAAHPGRQKTRKFIVNWLNRQDRPIDNGAAPLGRMAANRAALDDALRVLNARKGDNA